MRRWPAELRHPLFLLGAVLYAVSGLHKRQLVGPWQLWPPVLTYYLADLLTLPLELTLLLWFMRRHYFRNPAFVLPVSWIVSSWVVMAVWFEGILPRLNVHATADPLDVLAYAVGGFIFWRWLNHPARS